MFELGKFSHGVLTGELEQAVKGYADARYAVGVNSGADALLLTLRAVGIGEGDEVVMPAFASFSSAASICHAGARPIFADIEPGAYTMAPTAVRAVLTDRTKAIMPAHLFAQMADMTALSEIAREAGVMVIEDSANAIGMRYGGIHAGLLGTVGILSFFPTKTLGALGDAGMVITNDDGVAGRCEIMRHHGQVAETADGPYGISSTAALSGTNSKMDEIQAAILLARLPRLNSVISRRSGLAACYTERLSSIAEICTPVTVSRTDPVDQVWHMYLIEAERRGELKSHLARRGIETGMFCPLPLHQQPCFSHLNTAEDSRPAAEAAAMRTLALPLYPDLSCRDIEYVCQAIGQFYRQGAG